MVIVMKVKGIGVEVKNAPSMEKECADKKCPFHGPLTVRGKTYEGSIQSTSMIRTVVIRRDYLYRIKKYNRYERRHGKISAHVPECMPTIKVGQKVRAVECRPLSKSVSFVVVEILEEEN